jgi:hypothetical protein
MYRISMKLTRHRDTLWPQWATFQDPNPRERKMPILVCDHHLKDFDTWFKIFSSNPPPPVGKWRMARGTDDPNRVHLVAEHEASEVGEIKSFLASDKMQAVFQEVNKMSTAPLEFIWLDEITPN